jgi:hypothetical protein
MSGMWGSFDGGFQLKRLAMVVVMVVGVWLPLAGVAQTPTLWITTSGGYRSDAMPRAVADRFLFGGALDSARVEQWVQAAAQRPGELMRAGGAARAAIEYDSGKRWSVVADSRSIVDVRGTAGAVEAVFQGNAGAAGRTLECGGTAVRATALNSLGLAWRDSSRKGRVEVRAVHRALHAEGVVEEGRLGLSAAGDTLTAGLLGYGSVEQRDAWGLSVGMQWDWSRGRSGMQVRVGSIGFVVDRPGRVTWSADTALVTSGFSLADLRSEGFAERFYSTDTSAGARIALLPAHGEWTGYVSPSQRLWLIGSVRWGDWMPTPEGLVMCSVVAAPWLTVGAGVAAGGWGGWSTRAGWRPMALAMVQTEAGLNCGLSLEDPRGWLQASGYGRGLQVFVNYRMGKG